MVRDADEEQEESKMPAYAAAAGQETRKGGEDEDGPLKKQS